MSSNVDLCRQPVKHGHAAFGKHTPTYKAWRHMRKRCAAKIGTHHGKHYREKGITICSRWDNFLCFLEDMGPKPPGRTLDRENNTLGYSPENCRWATKAEQDRNRCNNVMLTLNDETRCMQDWCAQFGLLPPTVHYRLKAGWSVERTLTTPSRQQRKKQQVKCRPKTDA